MDKKQLVTLVSEVLETTKKDGEVFLANGDIIVEVLAEKLEAGEKVKLGKYATLEKVHIEEKEARNPRTGESVIVPAHDEVKIKRTDALKNMLK